MYFETERSFCKQNTDLSLATKRQKSHLLVKTVEKICGLYLEILEKEHESSM